MANNSVFTRFTTGLARLTYAFIWQPRASEEDGDDNDKKNEKKYSTSILIPKSDTATIEKLNVAIGHAVQAGQAKGLWGANLPSNFKYPLRDGDAEYLEKGEEYRGHWFLNASSTRKPRIVDAARNDIYDESEVYSGCYCRVCVNLFPFNQKGNRGIGCGLEAIQKIRDGEPLGGAPVDVDVAFADSEAYMEADAGYTQPMGMPQQAPAQMQGYPQQVAPAPVQQAQAYPQQVVPVTVQQAQAYPQQQAPAGYPGQQYPAPQGVQYQQPQQMQPPMGTFANNVAVAESVLPPHLFGEKQQVA